MELGIKPRTKVKLNGHDKVFYSNRFLSPKMYKYETSRDKSHSFKARPIESQMAYQCRSADAKAGRPADEVLTAQDIYKMRKDQGDLCFWCGDEMDDTKPRQKMDSMTVERLDNEVGHRSDNCVLACFECNSVLNISRLYAKMATRPYMQAKTHETREIRGLNDFD